MKLLLTLLFIFTLSSFQQEQYRKTMINGQRALVSKSDTIFIYDDSEVWGNDTIVEHYNSIIKRTEELKKNSAIF